MIRGVVVLQSNVSIFDHFDAYSLNEYCDCDGGEHMLYVLQQRRSSEYSELDWVGQMFVTGEELGSHSDLTDILFSCGVVEGTQFECLVSEDVEVALPVSLDDSLNFEEQLRMFLDEILDRSAIEVSFVQNIVYLLLTVDFLNEQTTELNHMACLLLYRALQN